MQIKEVINVIEAFAPPVYQENYDNAGLLVGDKEAEVRQLLLTLDVTEEVIEEALEKNCNLIIAHHPVIFGSLKKLTGANYVEKIVIKAIKNDIAIYAAHTNLDNVKQGVSGLIAEKLGLINTKILSPTKGILKKLYTFCPKDDAEKIMAALFEAGAGHIGNYSECSFRAAGEGTFKAGEGADPYVGEKGSRHTEAEVKIEVIFPAPQQRAIISALLQCHPYEEVAFDIIKLENAYEEVGSGIIGELKEPVQAMDFLKFVQKQMKTACIRYTELPGKTIERVAVCGGAGSFLLPQAINKGADIFITGDFKYHQFFDAEKKLIIADIGHYESEQFTVELFYNILTEKFRNFAPLISSTYTNPVNYLS